MSDEPTAQDAEQADEAQAAPDATAEQADLSALLVKANKDRSQANKEAQAAKKATAKMEAELTKYREAEAAQKEAELTDLEKFKAKADEALALAAETEKRLAANDRKIALIKAGVGDAYLDYLTLELTTAQEAGDAEDVSAWLESYKESKPAFFNGTAATPAPKAGTGGPAVGMTGAAAKKAELDAQYTALKGKGGDDDILRRLQTVKELKEISGG